MNKRAILLLILGAILGMMSLGFGAGQILNGAEICLNTSSGLEGIGATFIEIPYPPDPRYPALQIEANPILTFSVHIPETHLGAGCANYTIEEANISPKIGAKLKIIACIELRKILFDLSTPSFSLEYNPETRKVETKKAEGGTDE